MATTRAVNVRRLNAIFQQADEPIFVLDADRKLIYVNRAWEELTGHSIDEVAGLACLPHEPDPNGGLEGLVGSFCPPPEALEGQPASVLALIVHAEGSRQWKRLEFWPLRGREGQRSGLLGLARDSEAVPHWPESDSQKLCKELREVQQMLWDRRGQESLIGRGPSHRRLLEQVATAASATVPVLILGEPGTGKQQVAFAIQQSGPHPQGPMLRFDAEALPANLLDRELFENDESGGSRLRAPEEATVLLENLLALPRDLQARLASAMEGPGPRILATSQADPDEAHRDGQLREDLYFAMTCLVIQLLPLRERLDELPLLAQSILEQTNLRQGYHRYGFTNEAIDVLLAYDWPGNLTELSRVLQAAQTRAQGDLITAEDLPASIQGELAASYPPPPMPTPTPMDQVLEQVERRLIEQALRQARQNKSRAADLLAISRPRLYRRIKDLGIPEVSESQDGAASGDS